MTLFRTSTAQGIGARAHQRKLRASTLDQFAERLAEHGNVARAADEVGATHSYGRAMLVRIRKKLGWQAV